MGLTINEETGVISGGPKNNESWLPEFNVKNVALGVLAIGGLVLSAGALAPEEAAFFGSAAAAADIAATGALSGAELTTALGAVEAETLASTFGGATNTSLLIGSTEATEAWLGGDLTLEGTEIWNASSEAANTSFLADNAGMLEESATSNVGGMIRSQSTAAFDSIKASGVGSDVFDAEILAESNLDFIEGETLNPNFPSLNPNIPSSDFPSLNPNIPSADGLGSDAIKTLKRNFTPGGNTTKGLAAVGFYTNLPFKKNKKIRMSLGSAERPEFSSSKLRTSSAIKSQQKFLPSIF